MLDPNSVTVAYGTQSAVQQRFSVLLKVKAQQDAWLWHVLAH